MASFIYVQKVQFARLHSWERVKAFYWIRANIHLKKWGKEASTFNCQGVLTLYPHLAFRRGCTDGGGWAGPSSFQGKAHPWTGMRPVLAWHPPRSMTLMLVPLAQQLNVKAQFSQQKWIRHTLAEVCHLQGGRWGISVTMEKLDSVAQPPGPVYLLPKLQLPTLQEEGLWNMQGLGKHITQVLQNFAVFKKIYIGIHMRIGL